MERRYLGSFSVPFETIYTEGRIEGVFRIDTPPINFGYDHAASGVTRREKQQSHMFEGEYCFILVCIVYLVVYCLLCIVF